MSDVGFLKSVGLVLFVLGMSVRGYASEVPRPGQRSLEVLHVKLTAYASKTAVVPMTIDGQAVQGAVKGLATVSSTTVVNERFASRAELKRALETRFCAEPAPYGVIEFNAGRNISAQLGVGSLPARMPLRAEATFVFDSTRPGETSNQHHGLSVKCPAPVAE